VPRRLGAELEEASVRPAGFLEAQQRQQRGDPAGPELAARPSVAQSPGALRGGSGQGQGPLLHAAAQGPDQSAADPGSGLPAAQPGLPGLIGLFGIHWQLSAGAQSTVRDQLALTQGSLLATVLPWCMNVLRLR